MDGAGDKKLTIQRAQEKYGRVFQTGSMQRSWAKVSEFRAACMIVRNGYIGDLKYVDANYGRGGQKLGGPSHQVRFFDRPENAAKEGAPNADVDWNIWLGPATETVRAGAQHVARPRVQHVEEPARRRPA